MDRSHVAAKVSHLQAIQRGHFGIVAAVNDADRRHAEHAGTEPAVFDVRHPIVRKKELLVLMLRRDLPAHGLYGACGQAEFLAPRLELLASERIHSAYVHGRASYSQS